uniref:THAP-type domain-containing protein n=1 Tax=Schizaphis graminum TaxID=13262 RepID=A0A2S2NUI1_SCHGA
MDLSCSPVITYNTCTIVFKMVNKCSVLNCRSRKSKTVFSLFSAPKDILINNSWSSIVSRVNNKITNVKFICELHFKDSDIIRSYSQWNSPTISTTDELNLKVIKPRLQKGAIPSIFNDIQGKH